MRVILKLKRSRWRASCKGAQLCYNLLFWYVLAAVLTGFFGFPKILVYFGDIINVALFIKAAMHRGFSFPKTDRVFKVMLLFVVIALISGFMNFNSPFLLLWGIRQNFRFFIFYYSCMTFMCKDDYQILFRFVKLLFWVSLPLCIYEALFVTYEAGTIVGDYVGGIYYGIQGVDAPLNIVMIIYCTKSLIDYFNKKLKVSQLVLILVAAISMSILSELKIFLVESVLIATIVMVRKGISVRTMLLCCLGAFSVGIIIQAFVDINGGGRSYYTTDYFSIQSMIETALRSTGYDGTGDLNRFFAVQKLTEMFFKDNPIGFLFGLGLGNAEYSTGFDFLTSVFYSQYSWLHYQYFSVSFVFIETGILGLIVYFMIFVSGVIQGRLYIDRNSDLSIFYSVMLVIMFVMIFYNPSLRNEQCGFMLYMILAMPIVCWKDKRKKLLSVPPQAQRRVKS